jgi:cobalt/nickel transport system permease protein
MHISDGILPVSISIAGYAGSLSIIAYKLKMVQKIKEVEKEIPKVSILTAAFFISSTIHIPVPPTSVHMLLIGIIGIFLGHFSFLSIFIGLFFQAVIFGHGGIMSLGVNGMIFGIGAIFCSYLYKILKPYVKTKVSSGIIGFLIGSVGVIISTIIFTCVIILFMPEGVDVVAERYAVMTLALIHIPLAIIEGSLTSGILMYVMRVKPSLLEMR